MAGTATVAQAAAVDGLRSSSALLPSCDNSGLRGALKPVARRADAVANALTPARCMVPGAAVSCRRKTKAEAETSMATTWTAWTARTAPALAISRRQGGFINQQGQEVATEGSGVGADGRTMMQQWSRQMTAARAAAVAQAAAVGDSSSSSPPPPS